VSEGVAGMEAGRTPTDCHNSNKIEEKVNTVIRTLLRLYLCFNLVIAASTYAKYSLRVLRQLVRSGQSKISAPCARMSSISLAANVATNLSKLRFWTYHPFGCHALSADLSMLDRTINGREIVMRAVCQGHFDQCEQCIGRVGRH
jgi:hypothetical protein